MKLLIKSHKWLGLIASLFIIIFSLSGIFLNHRQGLASVDIPRSMLPSAYRYSNWNNAAIKGSLKLSSDSILMYGGSGIWLTDSTHSDIKHYVEGIRKGADNRNTIRIIRTANGNIFALTIFNLYQLDRHSNTWTDKTKMLGTNERLSDISNRGDSVAIVSRSHLYVSNDLHTAFDKIELAAPQGYENKISAFRAFWTIHSGEMFGLVGRLVVDFVGVVFIVLCITGLVVLFFPKMVRRRKSRASKIKLVSFLKSNLKWHNKIGAWFLLLGAIVILTGIFLRPPAMILIVRDKINPIPGSVHHTENAWFDKLRNIRYDSLSQEWMIHSSEGFFTLKSFSSIPQALKNTPRVSVMGINVLEEIAPSLWIVGSFSGLYYWDKSSGRSVDISHMRPIFLEGERIATAANVPASMKNVIGGIDVSGYSIDFPNKEVVFSYSSGAMTVGHPMGFAEMPKSVKKVNMSLWHLSLEAHVGRIYTPIVNGVMGESSFVLLSGIVMLIIYISGYIVYRVKHKRKKLKRL